MASGPGVCSRCQRGRGGRGKVEAGHGRGDFTLCTRTPGGAPCRRRSTGGLRNRRPGVGAVRVRRRSAASALAVNLVRHGPEWSGGLGDVTVDTKRGSRTA